MSTSINARLGQEQPRIEKTRVAEVLAALIGREDKMEELLTLDDLQAEQNGDQVIITIPFMYQQQINPDNFERTVELSRFLTGRFPVDFHQDNDRESFKLVLPASFFSVERQDTVRQHALDFSADKVALVLADIFPDFFSTNDLEQVQHIVLDPPNEEGRINIWIPLQCFTKPGAPIDHPEHLVQGTLTTNPEIKNGYFVCSLPLKKFEGRAAVSAAAGRIGEAVQNTLSQ